MPAQQAQLISKPLRSLSAVNCRRVSRVLPFAQALLQQSVAAQAVGALLSQLSQLPPKHMQLWWYAQDPAEQPGPTATHTGAAAQWLQRSCSALLPAATGPLPEPGSGQDPVAALAAWLMHALSSTTSAAASHRSTMQQQQLQEEQPPLQYSIRQPSPAQVQPNSAATEQTAAGFEQPRGGDSAVQAVHPAEALMPLVECLLTAVQYNHMLHLQE